MTQTCECHTHNSSGPCHQFRDKGRVEGSGGRPLQVVNQGFFIILMSLAWDLIVLVGQQGKQTVTKFL